MIDLIFDTETIAGMDEKTALQLHKEAKEMEEQLHELRRLAWERVQQIRRDHVSPEQRDAHRKSTAKTKLRKAEKEYERSPSPITAISLKSALLNYVIKSRAVRK